jgi:stage V sporulation protein SpoVS
VITMLPSTEDDARELAPLLRAEDRAEVLALGVAPVDGLLQSLAAAREAWTYRDDGRIICMAGVAPLSLIGSTGIPWLLGSPLVVAHRRAFMVETRRMVARWLDWFPVLRNVVDARYQAAIRWLRWLGFTIGEPFNLSRGVFRVAQKAIP